MTAFERVTALIEQKTGYRGRGGSWRCPAHDDQHPSLTVADGGGKVVLHCHAGNGCSVDDICASIGITVADLFDQPRDQPDRPTIASTYPYRDEKGELIFEVVRFSPRGFRQRRPDGNGGHVWSLNGARRVLYRLPEAIEAVGDGRRIFVCEGEKDADAVVAAGEIATTNPGGAGKWQPAYTAALAGAAEVVIVADRDQPGYRHAAAVARALEGHVASIKVAMPIEGKDAADHLAAGHTLDELAVWPLGEVEQLCEPKPADHGPVAPDAPDEAGDHEVGGALRAAEIRSRLLTPAAVDNLADPGWLIDGYLPAGGLAAIFGRPGSFKTFVGLDWGCSITSGTWWLGRKVNPGPVVYVMAEGVGGLRARKQAWETGRNVLLANFPIYWYPQPINLLDPEWAAGLALVAAELGAVLTVLDTVARCMPGGDENTGKDMGRLICAADEIRERSGGAVLLVHHTPIGGDRLRGHSSLEGALDTNIGCESDGTTVKITVDKQKDAEPVVPMLVHPEPCGESIVLRPGSSASDGLPPQVLEVLRSLDAIDVGGGVSVSQWDAATDAAKRTFFRARKLLVERGLCQTVTGTPGTANARYQVSDLGKETLHS